MESLPDTRVIMLTASTEAEAVIEAVAAGATGYLQKVSGMDRLMSTIKVAAAGEMRLPTDGVRRVFARIRSGGKAEEEADLTPREKEILASFSRGMSIRRDCGGKGSQAGYHPKRHLHQSGEAGSWHEAGSRGVGRAERSVG